MVRMLGAGLLVLALGGCAAPAESDWWRSLSGRPAAPAAFRFDWRIAGEPALAPLQVFDDGRRTWLQYPPEQPAPALFERDPGGDRLLRPRREGGYLVLSGVPRHIVLRGGHLQAEAWLEGAHTEAGAPPTVALAALPPAPALTSTAPVLPAVPPPAAPRAAGALPAPAGARSLVPDAAPGPAAAILARPEPARAVPSAVSVRPPPSFDATPADGNIRRALGRWARSAGWVFESEHWAVDVDIPLAGSAAFGDDFRPAVRSLLAATELGDRPVQPCFYANRVLRVIPLAQRCDRTQGPGALS